VKTSTGQAVPYDILVLATGSDAVVPQDTPGHDAIGVFVYRNIEDLNRMITYSAEVKGTTGLVVGGGLLGLEAAKAMMDLEQFGAGYCRGSWIEMREGWLWKRCKSSDWRY
jgi:nitrite reductase (NAD(P)H)